MRLGIHATKFTGAAVFILLLASRLPFLSAGYGWDNDAWGNVECARILDLGLGGFQSRPPGYPAVVLLYSYIWQLGPWVVNGVTALFSAAAAIFFMRSLVLLGLASRFAALGALALSFTPVVFINSCNAMDYLWALAFAMGALYYSISSRPAMAGLFLGMAIGCRITSAAMWIPFAILLGMRRAVLMGVVAVAAGAFAFSPVLLEHGLAYLRFADQPFSAFAGYLPYSTTIGIWGIIGCAGVLFALGSFALSPGNSLANSLLPARKREVAAALAAISIYIVAFLRLPVEAAYLIPAIPFVLMLGAFVLHRRDYVLACATLCLSPFIFHIAPDPRGITAVGSSRSHNELRWAGPIFWMHHERDLQMKCIRRVFELVEKSPAPKVTINAGTYFVYLTTTADPGQAARMDVAQANQGRADLYLRGYDNKIMLAYTPERLEFLLATDAHRNLVELQPSALERALIATTVNPGAADQFYQLLIDTTFHFPSDKNGPVRVSYYNSTGIPLYEDASRISALPGNLRSSTIKSIPFREVLKLRTADERLLLNLGYVTERILTPDEILCLSALCN